MENISRGSVLYDIFLSLSEYWLMLDDIKLGHALGFSFDFSLRDFILCELLLLVICCALYRIFHHDYEE